MPNQQLIDYIKQARAIGKSDAEIKSALLNAGWQEDAVNESFASLLPAVSRSPKIIIAVASVVAALLLAGGGFAYWYFVYEPVQQSEVVALNTERIRQPTNLEQNHTNSTGECKADSDCEYLFNSCPEGLELCAPRWGAFCVNGKCELSHDVSLSKSEQWVQTCKAHQERGISIFTLEECYQNAAYASLRKSSSTMPYNIIYTEAFQVCDASLGNSSERCKLDICDNLHLGDGNIKYDYPEESDCRAEAIKHSSCSDGSKNGLETDIDCGGPGCKSCQIGGFCSNNSDCQSEVCGVHGIKNQDICYAICPNGSISQYEPCGCFQYVTPQGKVNKTPVTLDQDVGSSEAWEDAYGNGKRVYCCGGKAYYLSSGQDCTNILDN